MDKSQGSEFLLTFDPNYGNTSSADRTSAEELSELLGGLPLGLMIMAFQIRRRRKNMAQFVEFYRKHEDRILGTHDPLISLKPFYTRNLTTAWNMSFQSLNKPTSKLLGVISLLNPIDIPLSVFQLTATACHSEVPSFCLDTWESVIPCTESCAES
jgi:hypothetical protein